jgi:hypothetical protein
MYEISYELGQSGGKMDMVWGQQIFKKLINYNDGRWCGKEYSMLWCHKLWWSRRNVIFVKAKQLRDGQKF